MRRKITEAHLLLIITFDMYMGYQWLMQWIPLHHGTGDADFPRGIMDADTISEEQTAIVRKNAFYTDIQCQH